jgi:hypothetical protein
MFLPGKFCKSEEKKMAEPLCGGFSDNGRKSEKKILS